jgi:hypothetical protein
LIENFPLGVSPITSALSAMNANKFVIRDEGLHPMVRHTQFIHYLAGRPEMAKIPQLKGFQRP